MSRLDPQAEAALVARCAEGDIAAWDQFVAVYGPLLPALVRKMMSRRIGRAPDADVDEIVAEVFLALVRRERHLLKRFDPTYRLSTYLGVICRTHLLRHLRKGNRNPNSLDDAGHVPAPADYASPDRGLRDRERREAVDQLRHAMAHLPDRDRQLLELRYLDGLDYRSIGAALGLNPESVGQLLHRAKSKLAKQAPELSRWIPTE